MNILDEFVARAGRQPDALAVVSGVHRISYRELLVQAHSLALALAQREVRQGDTVAMMVSGPLPQICATLGLAWLGARSIAVGPGEPRVAALAQAAGATLLLHNLDSELRSEMRIAREIDLRWLPLDGPGSLPLAQTAPGDIWRIGVTSGSTGVPKGVCISVGAQLAKQRLVADHFPVGCGQRAMFGLSVLLPAMWGYWVAVLSEGGTLLLPAEEGGELCRVAHEEQATFVLASAGAAVAMLEAARAPGSPYADPAPSVKLMWVTGSTVAPTLRDSLRRHLAPAICVNYGSSEAGMISILDEALQRSHPDSAGRVAPSVQIEAVDEHDTPVPPGSVGRLRVRSPMLASGYVGAAAATAGEGFRDGWFYMSDSGAVTADGLVYLEGRGADVLNVYGNKIAASRIEAVVAQDPAVTECAVIQLDHEGKVELVAVVVAGQGFDESGALERCRAAFVPTLVPRRIARAQRLPRNGAGKVLRDALVAQVRAALAARASAPAPVGTRAA